MEELEVQDLFNEFDVNEELEGGDIDVQDTEDTSK